MERERSGKIIAIATLIVGIIGLSLGFAAFSTSLNITSSADVQIDSSVWKVGFSTANNALTPGTVTGSDGTSTLDLTQFVISQGTKAVLSTVSGSSVTYNFYIANAGELDAYLNSVTMGSLTCGYLTSPSPSPRTTDDGHTSITGGSGTIDAADCAKMFTATLVLDSTATFTSGGTGTPSAVSSGFGNTAKIARPASGVDATSIPASLTIAFNAGSMDTVTTAPNGDFTVSLGDSVVVYGTSSN